MTVAMLMAGLLFGIAFSVTLALFGIMSMDGHFKANVINAAAEIRRRITGRHRKARSTGPVRDIEGEAKLRALQEEVRVMQRLMDKSRVDRESQVDEMRRAKEEIVTLRAAVTERDERLLSVEATLHNETGKTGKLRDEFADQAALLAKSRREIKDLETELSVVQSGAGLSAVSDEIARLSAERDELTARLERMSKPVAVSK
jgi:chromosome segregation ATPase